MKMQFKFAPTGFISFIVLCALFYWLIPLPAQPIIRLIVCILLVLFAFAASFIVVTHKTFIRKK